MVPDPVAFTWTTSNYSNGAEEESGAAFCFVDKELSFEDPAVDTQSTKTSTVTNLEKSKPLQTEQASLFCSRSSSMYETQGGVSVADLKLVFSNKASLRRSGNDERTRDTIQANRNKNHTSWTSQRTSSSASSLNQATHSNPPSPWKKPFKGAPPTVTPPFVDDRPTTSISCSDKTSLPYMNERKMSFLEEKCQRLERTVEDLERDRAELYEKLGGLEKSQEKSLQDMMLNTKQHYEKVTKVLEGEKEKLSIELDKSKKEVTILQTSLEQQIVKCKESENTIQNQQAELNQLRQQLQSREQQLNDNQREIVSMTKERQELYDKVDTASELRELVSTQQVQIESLCIFNKELVHELDKAGLGKNRQLLDSIGTKHVPVETFETCWEQQRDAIDSLQQDQERLLQRLSKSTLDASNHTDGLWEIIGDFSRGKHTQGTKVMDSSSAEGMEVTFEAASESITTNNEGRGTVMAEGLARKCKEATRLIVGNCNDASSDDSRSREKTIPRDQRFDLLAFFKKNRTKEGGRTMEAVPQDSSESHETIETSDEEESIYSGEGLVSGILYVDEEQKKDALLAEDVLRLMSFSF